MQMRTSHLEIRKRILDEKGRITDEELFSSPAFAAYLSDIGETVAKRYGRPPFGIPTPEQTPPGPTTIPSPSIQGIISP